jgi:hypothetical protein
MTVVVTQRSEEIYALEVLLTWSSPESKRRPSRKLGSAAFAMNRGLFN